MKNMAYNFHDSLAMNLKALMADRLLKYNIYLITCVYFTTIVMMVDRI